MNTKEVIQLYNQYVMSTYIRTPIVIVKGKGLKVWDVEGKEYLDFFPSWGVSGLGHCHPIVVNAIKNYLHKIIHVSNNYYNIVQARLARLIVENSFEGKVFFCNSGAEANEAAFKLARLWGSPRQRYEIIAMENSFHGRTLATITATGQTKFQKGFEPLPEGFKHVPLNDFDALEKAVTEKTTGIILEIIQGEGGIYIAEKEYVKKVRGLCDRKDLLLILDEVQTGIGRTGKIFCYQHYGIEPDIMTLAKSLGGGIPIGAMIAKTKIADAFKPGMHASTFGGSPVACSAALGVFKALKKEKLLTNTVKMSEYLIMRLNELKTRCSVIKEIRGIGLMIGVELNIDGNRIVQRCLENGLLINCTHDRVLRLMPAMTVTKKEIDKAVGILDEAFM